MTRLRNLLSALTLIKNNLKRLHIWIDAVSRNYQINVAHSVYNCMTTQIYHLLDKTKSDIYDLNSAYNLYALIVHFCLLCTFYLKHMTVQVALCKRYKNVHLTVRCEVERG